MPEDLYDEDLDSPMAAPGAQDEESDKEDYGETFLAPKSAFAGKDLEVGSVHKVRIEAMHDQEVELRCIQSEDKEKSVSEPEPEEDEMYQ